MLRWARGVRCASSQGGQSIGREEAHHLIGGRGTQRHGQGAVLVSSEWESVAPLIEGMEWGLQERQMGKQSCKGPQGDISHTSGGMPCASANSAIGLRECV